MSLTKTRQRMLSDSTFSAPIDNILINGGMEVDQEHVGASGAVGSGYALDGWIASKSGTMVCTVQQVADAPAGFSNSLKITVGTAEASLGAGDFCFIYQPIEGFRTSQLGFGAAGAQSVTLSFWTKIHRTGTYSGAISNSAGTRAYPFSFAQNVADTWEYKTVTIPGDVTGTWIGNTNALALRVLFTVASGSTYTGTVNTWAAANLVGVTGTVNGVAATSDVFQITGVCLLPGTDAPSAAVSPLIKRSLDQEIQACQRYYEKSYSYGTAIGATSVGGFLGATSSGVGFLCIISFKTKKRAAPTLTSYSYVTGAAGKVYDGGASADVIATVGSQTSDTAMYITATTAANAFGYFHFVADARL